MANLDDRPLDDLQDLDPRFAHDMDSGDGCRPRGRRRGSAWLFLAAALALLATGLLLPQGLLLAAGLILAGVAAGQVSGQVFGTRAGEDQGTVRPRMPGRSRPPRFRGPRDFRRW